MLTSKLTTRLFWAFEALTLTGTVGAAALLSRTEDWQPLAIVGLLLVLSLVGHRLTVMIGGGMMTAGAHRAGAGDVPAGPRPRRRVRDRRRDPHVGHEAPPRAAVAQQPVHLLAVPARRVADGASYRRRRPQRRRPGGDQGRPSRFIVFAVFLVTVALNFATVALDVLIDEGRSLSRQVREAFIPLLPGHLAAGVLAAILAVAYTNLGNAILFGSVLVLGIFHYLTTR